MKIALIHSDKKIATGAHYINDLISIKLKNTGVVSKNFYPKVPLIKDSEQSLKGLANILFFYSLLEHRKEIFKYDLVQGTTYTPLPFLAYDIPTVSHFGSSTRQFINSVPLAKNIEKETKSIWYELKNKKIIDEVNVKTRRPLRDIAEIEKYVASRVDAIIATSQKVKEELMQIGAKEEKITVIHNAIEDYWYENTGNNFNPIPKLVFLGRIGKDVFTLKLKGVDRLVHLYRKFPTIKKVTICMTSNKKLKEWMRENIKEQDLFVNFKKDLIPNILNNLKGSILFLPSRYEGFSLSLIEGMSQGLIPVAYPVGVAAEVIKNGFNGYIVNDQKEAIDCIKNLLSQKELREKMASEAQNSSLNFRSELMAEKMIYFYKEVIRLKSKEKEIEG
ncbi:MAG TPA: glycosyltransferase [Candidatus Portnoybacteria bacterium]|nr:glycosyltransferase [Candidatus Portnoybacteria bacterium]